MEGAERNTGIPQWDSKFQVEEYLRASGLPSYTILRPASFCENFPSTSGITTFFAFGWFDAALAGKKLQFVSVRDIGKCYSSLHFALEYVLIIPLFRTGWFAAKALENPEKYSGRVIPLAGDDLSISEIQDAYQRVNGIRPWKAPIPAVVVRRLLPFDFRKMLQVTDLLHHVCILVDLLGAFSGFMRKATKRTFQPSETNIQTCSPLRNGSGFQIQIKLSERSRLWERRDWVWDMEFV